MARNRLVGGVLSTDAYQLTMAQVYLRLGLHERRVRFEHLFRRYPDYGTHSAGYAIAAGLGPFAEWMRTTRARPADVEALRGQRGVAGEPLFDQAFLAWFSEVSFAPLELTAVAEGRVVHPNTPITVVEGPLPAAQLLETPLLNQLNFATLVATKAARVVAAAGGRPVMEFGLRRAPGPGGDVASRAAIVGGATSTSNTAVAHELGRSPSGTHAHSMVQLMMALGEGEEAAFAAYADVYPDDCLLLVDTIDTLGSGVPHAIRVFEGLARRGHRPLGIRLDSGDLAHLAVRSAQMLDAAGFDDAVIVLSNQLDEVAIWQITGQIVEEARAAGVDADHVVGRLVYGVGSRLAASHGDPSLDGVYKLVAVEDRGRWQPAIKVSESAAKVLNPGRKHLWRVYDERGRATADVLSTADEVLTPGTDLALHHHSRPDVGRTLAPDRWSRVEDLHQPVPTTGDAGDTRDTGDTDLDDLDAIAARREADLAALDPGVRRLVNPHVYHVSITGDLLRLKQELVARHRRAPRG